MAKSTFGMSSKKSLINQIISGESTIYSRRKTRINFPTVKEFICRDDNSRVTTSKTDTITRNKVKNAATNSLWNDGTSIHTKFSQEYLYNIRYSLFCRLKPFYVVHATILDRESCLCKQHENCHHILVRLSKLNVITSSIQTMEDVVAAAVCPNPTLNAT